MTHNSVEVYLIDDDGELIVEREFIVKVFPGYVSRDDRRVEIELVGGDTTFALIGFANQFARVATEILGELHTLSIFVGKDSPIPFPEMDASEREALIILQRYADRVTEWDKATMIF